MIKIPQTKYLKLKAEVTWDTYCNVTFGMTQNESENKSTLDSYNELKSADKIEYTQLGDHSIIIHKTKFNYDTDSIEAIYWNNLFEEVVDD